VGEKPYLPTPEEIRAACLEIQDTWSPAERYRRAPWAWHQSQFRWQIVDDSGAEPRVVGVNFPNRKKKP